MISVGNVHAGMNDAPCVNDVKNMVRTAAARYCRRGLRQTVYLSEYEVLKMLSATERIILSDAGNDNNTNCCHICT